MSNIFCRTALWGGLFDDAQIAGLFSAEAFTGRMLEVERALTEALAANGTIRAEQATAIHAALDHPGLDMAALGAGSLRDGVPVPALIAHLRARLPEPVQSALHQGATSQDVIDTAMVLTLGAVARIFTARLAQLSAALAQQIARAADAQIHGRTRMQAALPIPARARIGAWQAGIAASRTALDRAAQDLAQLQFGGPVGQRDLPGAEHIAAHMARNLGLRAAPCWHTERSAMVGFGHALARISGACGKLGLDITLMAQQGIGEVTLSGGGGSSAMAHKSNPILAETLISLARFTAHQQGLLETALLHEQERSGSAWMTEWLTLPAMCESTGTALGHAQRLCAQISCIGSAD